MTDKLKLKYKLEAVLNKSDGTVDQKVRLIDKNLTTEERNKYILSIDPFINQIILIDND